MFQKKRKKIMTFSILQKMNRQKKFFSQMKFKTKKEENMTKRNQNYYVCEENKERKNYSKHKSRRKKKEKKSQETYRNYNFFL